MTVEEIEIIVTAKVEEALKEVLKMAPTIKKMVQQVQENFQKVDTKVMKNKIQQAVQFTKKKMQDLKKSTENNQLAIKVNNKDAEKQISQIQKQIDSLQEKINARQLKLDLTNNSIDKINAETKQQVIKDLPSAKNKEIKQESYNRLNNNANYIQLIKESDKLNSEIEKYNLLLTTAKSKIIQIQQEANKIKINTDISEAKRTIESFRGTIENQKYQVELNWRGNPLTTLDFNPLIKQLKSAKQHMLEFLQNLNKTETSQNKLTSFFYTLKNKIEQSKTSVNKLKGTFNQMPKITQKITNNVKNIGTGMKSGLGHVLKYAGALFSLRGIYSMLSSSAQSWLSSQNVQAKQLSANIEYMRYAMGSALAPVIQFVTNLIYQLMKAIQSVAYALTGVNIFAKATASSMKSTSKSAKDTSKSLAGVHSDINNISKNDNSGGGDGSINPNMDLSQMDTSMNSWVEKIKEELMILFQPVQNSWNKYGQPLIESMKYSFNSSLDLIKSIGKSFREVWTNGTGEHTVNTILQTLTSIFNIIGNIKVAFTNAWEDNGGTQIIQNLWNALNNILDIILSVYQTFEQWTASQSFQDFANAIIGICNTLSYWFEIITKKLKEIWENGGKETFEKLLNFISKLTQAIDEILKFLTPIIEYILNTVQPIIEGIVQAIGFILDALSGLLDFIIGVFSGDWEKAWQGICDFFTGIWNAVSAVISGILNFICKLFEGAWNGICDTFSGIGQWFSDRWNDICNVFSGIGQWFTDRFNEAVQGIQNIFSGIGNFFSGVWQGICDVFGNVANWFGNIFGGAWEAVKNVFSTGGRIFDGIKDGILNGLKAIVNAIINGINKVVAIPFRGINTALRALRNLDLWGWQPFSWLGTINVPQIPTLAKGGVLYDDTIVRAGEYSGASSNPEIVTPQNIMYDTVRRALIDSDFGNDNNDRPIYLTINVGNKKIGEIALEDIRDIRRQTGKDIEVLVGG